MKIGDTLIKPDGSPWTEQDGMQIIVINQGIALVGKNHVDIILKNILGKEERITISIESLKEIAKNLK
jgi:F0F1-type ATP synthase epsilon subunit